jgi:hypothetical protein
MPFAGVTRCDPDQPEGDRKTAYERKRTVETVAGDDMGRRHDHDRSGGAWRYLVRPVERIAVFDNDGGHHALEVKSFGLRR